MGKRLLVGGVNRIHDIDLDTFTYTRSVHIGYSGVVWPIVTVDDLNIICGWHSTATANQDKGYIKYNPALDVTGELNLSPSGDWRTRTNVWFDPSDSGIIYLMRQYYVEKRNIDFELLDAVGGTEDPYPYYDGDEGYPLFIRSGLIAHDPDHDKMFLYYGGLASLAYYYYTSIYCVPLDDIDSVPEGDFKAIGRTSSLIHRENIDQFVHYVDGNGVPYIFCSGRDYSEQDTWVNRLSKVRLTDPWTIEKTPDGMSRDCIATQWGGDAFLYNGYIYLVGSITEPELNRKAISIINPDTLALEDKHQYDEDLDTEFRHAAVDEENGVLYTANTGGKIVKIKLSDMSIDEVISTGIYTDILRSICILGPLPVATPILNLSQDANKIKVGWGYGTE